jgi:hypothetical protein
MKLMSHRIQNKRLTNFLKTYKHNNFAKITYNCGAICFVHKSNDWNHETGELLQSYEFHEPVLDDEEFGDWKYTYYVLFVPNKSYLMYEIEENKITTWVCYTEEIERGQGYMTDLLKELISIYPQKKIMVDTFDEGLTNICSNLKQIELFRQ